MNKTNDYPVNEDYLERPIQITPAAHSLLEKEVAKRRAEGFTASRKGLASEAILEKYSANGHSFGGGGGERLNAASATKKWEVAMEFARRLLEKHGGDKNAAVKDIPSVADRETKKLAQIIIEEAV